MDTRKNCQKWMSAFGRWSRRIGSPKSASFWNRHFLSRRPVRKTSYEQLRTFIWARSANVHCREVSLLPIGCYPKPISVRFGSERWQSMDRKNDLEFWRMLLCAIQHAAFNYFSRCVWSRSITRNWKGSDVFLYTWHGLTQPSYHFSKAIIKLWNCGGPTKTPMAKSWFVPQVKM